MDVHSPIIASRFWRKVNIRGPHDCWNWTASTRGRQGQEYGTFSIDGKMLSANRVAWELANKEHLGDKLACHTCDNPLCCNPRHIYAGTHKTNRRDAIVRGRAVIPTPGQRWANS